VADHLAVPADRDLAERRAHRGAVQVIDLRRRGLTWLEDRRRARTCRSRPPTMCRSRHLSTSS
jgi:hypothetical protein